MYPIVSLFGLSLGTYGICCVIGGALAIWLAIRNGKRFQQDRFAMLEACVWALIGGFLGAKLLYLLVSFSDIVEMFQTSGFNWNTISSLLEGGLYSMADCWVVWLPCCSICIIFSCPMGSISAASPLPFRLPMHLDESAVSLQVAVTVSPMTHRLASA